MKIKIEFEKDGVATVSTYLKGEGNSHDNASITRSFTAGEVFETEAEGTNVYVTATENEPQTPGAALADSMTVEPLL